MRQTDQILARYGSEIEEKQTFIDGLVEGAEKESRDLTDAGDGAVTRTRDRLGELNEQIGPLQEARRISSESAGQVADMHQQMVDSGRERPGKEQSTGPPARTCWTIWKAVARRHRAPASGSTCSPVPRRIRPPPTTRACCPSS